MQLLAKNGRVVNGKILFHQRQKQNGSETIPTIDITQLDPDGDQIRSLRG